MLLTKLSFRCTGCGFVAQASLVRSLCCAPVMGRISLIEAVAPRDYLEDLPSGHQGIPTSFRLFKGKPPVQPPIHCGDTADEKKELLETMQLRSAGERSTGRKKDGPATKQLKNYMAEQEGQPPPKACPQVLEPVRSRIAQLATHVYYLWGEAKFADYLARGSPAQTAALNLEHFAREAHHAAGRLLEDSHVPLTRPPPNLPVEVSGTTPELLVFTLLQRERRDESHGKHRRFL
eukprot:Skav208642  [mRNA]  locus=scaffold1081:127912:129505:- [translate_table: standard]